MNHFHLDDVIQLKVMLAVGTNRDVYSFTEGEQVPNEQ